MKLSHYQMELENMRIPIMCLFDFYKVHVLSAFMLIVLSIFPSFSHAYHEQFEHLSLSELSDVDIFAASILSAHIHKKNEVMVAYKFRHMNMDGNQNGRDRLSRDDVLRNYLVAPTSMTMDMQMLHLMYAPTDDLTLMLMLSDSRKRMEHYTRMGTKFVTHSSGIGDTVLSGNYIFKRTLTDKGERALGIKFGVSIPTGSINEKDRTPMSGGSKVRLPYPMQLGSGTWDIIIGGIYLDFIDSWYWGAEITTLIRTKKNKYNYRLGNEYSVSGWLNYAWSDRVSTYTKLSSKYKDNIHGSDPEITQQVAGVPIVPTADPNKRLAKLVDLAIGVEWILGFGQDSGHHRLAFDYGIPLYQSFDGPQLKTKNIASVSWQYNF